MMSDNTLPSADKMADIVLGIRRDQRVVDRRDALQKELRRVDILEKLAQDITRADEVLKELGLSAHDKTAALEPLRAVLSREIEREPYIPGVPYIRPG